MIVSADTSQIHALEQRVETLAAWLTGIVTALGGYHLPAHDLAAAVSGQTKVRQRGDGFGGQIFEVVSATLPPEKAPDLRQPVDTPEASSGHDTPTTLRHPDQAAPQAPPSPAAVDRGLGIPA